jgi:phenazine biosynthesis protein phzE
VLTGHAAALLDRITGDVPPAAFALIHRPGCGHGGIDLIAGEPSSVAATTDIPLRPASSRAGHDILALLPYRQLAERGLPCRDDAAPLLVLKIVEQAVATVDEVSARIHEAPTGLRGGGFDLDDQHYAESVRRIQREEIGTGAGSNFVLKRSYTGRLDSWSISTALALFRRLLHGEKGTHWTFLIRIGERTLLGASPERHISLQSGLAVMNPISGTYRDPPAGPTPAGLLRFLADGKEANELYMVLDEELKMMSRICPDGGWVRGPYLHEMSRLAHTGYHVEGHTELDARLILRETMFAPTIVGSPLASACEVTARHEPTGRSYYGGIAALIGHDEAGARRMDSAILIRTAEIDPAGQLRLDVGATLVRDSDPDREAAETTAKAAGVLRALQHPAAPHTDQAPSRHRLAERIEVRRALANRNATLAPFWQQQPGTRRRVHPGLHGKRLLIIDADDAFTHMGKTILGALGFDVLVRRYEEQWELSDFDAVVLGPGPGDPRQHRDPKISRLRQLAADLLESGTPFLAVCLGHQVLCTELGLAVIRKPIPNQGIQRRIEVFGRSELAYFYNTFAAVHDSDKLDPDVDLGPVEVCRDADSGEVHALRAPGFASLQFHPSSVMTPNGPIILAETFSHIMKTAIDPAPSH